MSVCIYIKIISPSFYQRAWRATTSARGRTSPQWPSSCRSRGSLALCAFHFDTVLVHGGVPGKRRKFTVRTLHKYSFLLFNTVLSHAEGPVHNNK